MDCIKCTVKSCRITESCKSQKFDSNQLMEVYHEAENQKIVQAAALLVDQGRAGTLSRMQEVIEFSKEMKFTKIGLAYCYGMESLATNVAIIFRENGFKVVPVSCTTGGFRQDEVNKNSSNNKVSCNPVAQAEQLNHEAVDLTLAIGLCLGHDMLFQKQINSLVSTLIVKDRVYSHNPLESIQKY